MQPAPRPEIQGRGALDNPAGRFEKIALQWEAHELADEEGKLSAKTTLYRDTTRTIISRNDSEDIPFECSINPYRGCEHGCIYCYARPYHEYLGLSAGLDFESKIFVKENAPDLLRHELSAKSWQPQTIVMSGVTDCYQPIERKLEITRRCLAVMAEFRNPAAIITKNALVTRDIDILGELAKHNCIAVNVSITTLDEDLRRTMEPRTSTAEKRLEAVAKLNAAGIPCGVMTAPIIPGLTDHEVMPLVEAAGKAGAKWVGYTVMRLPHGLKDLFTQWVETHFPGRKNKILNRVREIRGGELNDPRFGSRMKGEGIFADYIAKVHRMAREKAGIPTIRMPLSTEHFRVPGATKSMW
ncbi:MAG: PA0069 family radical SAM protein [Planctomycetes bacterium]|nr:PA0069 family radical SAM protein [Planctomycetota bacterium]